MLGQLIEKNRTKRRVVRLDAALVADKSGFAKMMVSCKNVRLGSQFKRSKDSHSP